ncbi:helix-turn-helix domain protein [Emticicia oligotrophica DSM 17448]|uniref:Helix-turn-helix domain protein n=1 Tax=Emticicia oligotrophica (strain DSM 17448 / CIP 109782 / MTCC 6937 / GPTSA100-15) TaxID=929562 RepID=A0ABM5N1P9_EMTOG|nr:MULTISPECIES: helix-turn-helix transcriptional regulator [Emticicia]AFK03388.1 helix-turn-helix domain protein [Emticicia oligotrophica DSM 17448]
MKKTIYTEQRKFLSARLIEARENAGLSQQEVAKTEIISQSEISKIENGQRRVEFLLLLELAKLYSKGLDFFTPNENP